MQNVDYYKLTKLSFAFQFIYNRKCKTICLKARSIFTELSVNIFTQSSFVLLQDSH